MKEEINLFKYTQKDLIGLLKKQREEYALEEYFNIEENLVYKVKRALDLRDLMKITKTNLSKTRKNINKYAKYYKRETDIKRLIEKQKEEIFMIESRYVSAIFDLMLALVQLYACDIFKMKLEDRNLLFEYEEKDLIVVNGIIKALKKYDSFNVDIDIILETIYYALEEYIISIQEGLDYREKFSNNFMFVCFPENIE